MAEYIEREEALALVRPDAPEDEKAAVTIATTKKLVRSIVRRTPAADVAPVVHGRWVAQCVVETDGGWTLEDAPYNEYQHSNPICSICRKTALLDGGEDYVASPYYPNCGARMDDDESEAR